MYENNTQSKNHKSAKKLKQYSNALADAQKVYRYDTQPKNRKYTQRVNQYSSLFKSVQV